MAGIPHHVLNRACRRSVLFAHAEDYRLFVSVLGEARTRFTMRVLAYAVMPNHWHLILWPEEDLQLSRFMHWLTLTHTQRWHTRHATTGTGAALSRPLQGDSGSVGRTLADSDPVRRTQSGPRGIG